VFPLRARSDSSREDLGEDRPPPQTDLYPFCFKNMPSTHVCMQVLRMRGLSTESSVTRRLIGSLWYVDTHGDVAAAFGWRVTLGVRLTGNRFLPTRNILTVS
jgi:hypothetical protein